MSAAAAAATIPRPRTPLDETLWREPAFVSAHGLGPDMIMHYFYMSPFYDTTSNNGQLLTQLMHNPAAAARITSQADFDAALKNMRGVEYVIAAGSAETGVWVIRKQLRKPMKEVVIAGQRQKVEEVTVLADYYILPGGNVYQAPTVGAVISNRVLNITRDLRETLKRAMSISSAAPATTPTPAEAPVPAGNATPNPSQQQPHAPPPPPQTNTSTTKAANQTFDMRRALDLSLRHRGEFMDDHAPLLGDPGSLLPPASGAGAGAAS
ncbi:MED6 mediator sub complex component-domain-containing protein [Sphaerosporella brunnea]|uniref:Mediator of RNA polymerase II transcription subunit 6 n=1 Tax=Sphaerosporella brunnea TaxID=1250544 RepID=A0A5J5ELW0_9PEZI|nr:MED6 mediator sub complex component-domain-containing protein [Sphaerosporella brunnea]